MQNTIIDERGSFAVTAPFPGRLGALLKSLKKVDWYTYVIFLN